MLEEQKMDPREAETEKDRYLSVDRPNLFEFHDAVLEPGRLDEAKMAFDVYGLNISRDAEQNPKGYDLQIGKANIVFREVSDFSCTLGRWKTDERGNWMPAETETVYRGKEALVKFKEDLRAGAEVWSHSIVDGDHYEIYGRGSEPFFLIRFKCSRLVIKWNDYQGPAWYELTKQFCRDLVLETPDGEMRVKAYVRIDYDPGELYSADDRNDIDPKEIRVGIRYGDKYFWGRGTDCSGTDAFADLQKKLPEGVFLKSCLTCRYGHQSPFSNAFDWLYCMKDVAVTEKTDLCPSLADPAEEERRRRCFTDICEDWAEQNEETFVYSNYPFDLKKTDHDRKEAGNDGI